MNTFTTLFLLALFIGTALQYWLSQRQAAFVRKHADRVPSEFSSSISLKEHQKAADYTLAKLSLGQVDLALGVLILLGWTVGGGLNLLDQFWQLSGWPGIWHGVGLILSVLIISSILELPTGLWRTFGIETRFGFNRNTPMRYFIDLILQVTIALVIGIPLLALILWLMQEAGNYWWIATWLVWMGFTLFFSWAYPTLIAPLFNKFKPLEEKNLRQRLEALLTRCGFHSNGMFVMDGSKRSAHGNAYFTGFGRNKRIVFFDTLLEGLSADEIEAVLAHELGHFKKRHVIKGMLMMAIVSFLGLALLGWLYQQDWFYQGLGVARQSDALALILFALALPVVSVFLQPIFSAISRKHEFEADDYAAQQADAGALISGLVKMYRDNANTLTSDPVFSAFYHSHPPAPVRIAHLSSKITV